MQADTAKPNMFTTATLNIPPETWRETASPPMVETHIAPAADGFPGFPRLQPSVFQSTWVVLSITSFCIFSDSVTKYVL